jgi:predicted NAD/FAD-dependent oxidoreductase
VIVNRNKYLTFDRNGNPIPNAIVQNFHKKFQEHLKQAKQLAFRSKQDIPLSTALLSIMNHKRFTELELDLFKKELFSFESYIGASYESLSARYWDQEEKWPGNNCFLTSSYQPILEILTNNIPIQLNTIVTKVNMYKDNIEVVADKAVFYADAVIITIPLGVLKKNDVEFNPPLPNYKQDAIQRLEMAVFNLTAIKFPTPFWPKSVHAMFFTASDALSIPVFFNLYPSTQPILVGLSGGERARQLENFTDTELIEKTICNFKKVFGTKIPDPESYVNTRWLHDHFSYGSYSYVPTGASGNDFEAIAQPVSDRLFFAGEATSLKYSATTHGAYLSGIREANRINNLYG